MLKGKIPNFKNSRGDIKIAAIVDGKLSAKIPTKEEGYAVEEIVCDKGAIAEWNEEKWGIFVSNLTESETICTITFDSSNNFRKLVELIESKAENVDQLLTNNEDINKIIINEEAMKLIANANNLKSQIKNNENYTTEVAKKFLNSTVISEEEKYNAGLPCYLYKDGRITSVIGDFLELKSSSNASFSNSSAGYQINAVISGTHGSIVSSNMIDVSQYNNLEMNYRHWTGYRDLTGTTTFGLSNDQTINSFIISNSETFRMSELTSNLKINIKNNREKYYLKVKLLHDGQYTHSSANIIIHTIILY